MDKTYTEAKKILDRISRNHEDWEDKGYSRAERQQNSTSEMPKNDIAAVLQAQLAVMTNLLQTMTLNQVNAWNGN